MPSMTRKYRYSNTKFWLLMATYCLVLTISSGYHILSIRRYEAHARREFAQTVSIILKTAEMLLVTQPRESLRILGESTVGKLQFASYQSPEVLQQWLTLSIQRHLSQSPAIRAIAFYDIYGDRQLQVGNSDCLDAVFSFDRFCIDADTPAILLSLPLYGLKFQRMGWMSASVMITPAMLQQVERDFGVKIAVMLGARTVYQDAGLPIPGRRLNLRIIPPAMRRDIFDATPERIFSVRHGLWYGYTVALGHADAPDALLFYGYRSVNAVLWRIVEAILINVFLLIATVLLFSYFHINYKYISHVYRAVVDGMDDMLGFKDLHGQYQVINMKMAYGLFDKHPKEVVGHTDTQLGLPADMATQCAESDADVLRAHAPLHLVESGTTAAGKFVVLDVLKTPMIHESGKLGGVVICGRDISEQTALQQALDALEESYFSSEWILAKMLQSLPEFIFVKDKQHRFIRASDSIATFHGLPDVIGKTDFDLHPPELAKESWREEERLLTGEVETFTHEERSYLPDGTMRRLLTTKSLIRDKRGHIAGIMGIGRDVTQLMDKQTAMEYVIMQITQQNLQQVEKIKRRQTDEIQENA